MLQVIEIPGALEGPSVLKGTLISPGAVGRATVVLISKDFSVKIESKVFTYRQSVSYTFRISFFIRKKCVAQNKSTLPGTSAIKNPKEEYISKAIKINKSLSI